MGSDGKTCGLDYEKEYYSLQKKVKELDDENDRLKQALVNLALKLFNS